MSKNQTAVEWLESQFANIDENRRIVFDKAKQIEKEQILEAVHTEGKHYYSHGQNNPGITFENFFNGK